MSTIKKAGIAATVATAATLFASAASADCSVSDSDKRGFFGDKTYSRTFAGNSVTKIWKDYCQPFIARTIAKEGIENGKFGMHCTGSLSCDIKGEIVNGKVQPLNKSKGLNF